MKPKIIGLTGPISSGKNEAAKILRRHGAYVIDADEVGHGLLIPQSDTWKKVIKTFGSKILMAGGRINRKKLAEVVFNEPRMLKKLNGIMHPEMKREIIKEIRAQSTRLRPPRADFGGQADKQCRFIIINAAVLKEMGLIPLVDEVWVVLADKSKRIGRLIKSGMIRRQAEARVAAQIPQKNYLKLADRVIRNDGSKGDLKRTILRIRAGGCSLSPRSL